MSNDARQALMRRDGWGERIHLNAAGVSPMTEAAELAGQRVLSQMRQGTFAVGGLIDELQRARTTFARLVGAQARDVGFFQTCAAAITQAAFGIPLRAGDEIVLLDQEYPSNAYPWFRAAERAGARVVVVKSNTDFSIDQQRLHDAITPLTRVVAVSAVQFSSGESVDLRALADRVHAHDGWLVVDAIQALGVVPFDLVNSGADLVCGGTHKWTLGPMGHGFLACAKGRAAQLAPLLVGAMTYGTPDDAVDPQRAPRDDARRFEPGNPTLLGAISGAASVELLLAMGIESVQAHALALRAHVVDLAAARGYAVLPQHGPLRSPICTVVPRGPNTHVVAELATLGFSTAARGGGVRIAPHIYNTESDIDAVFAALDRIERGG